MFFFFSFVESEENLIIFVRLNRLEFFFGCVFQFFSHLVRQFVSFLNVGVANACFFFDFVYNFITKKGEEKLGCWFSYITRGFHYIWENKLLNIMLLFLIYIPYMLRRKEGTKKRELIKKRNKTVIIFYFIFYI